MTTKSLIGTLHHTRMGGARRDGEQTLHGDRDLLFCWLNCSRGRDRQRTCCLPFFETLQRNKQAFLLWTESLYISREQERGDEVRTDSRLQGGQSVDVDRIARDGMNLFWVLFISIKKNIKDCPSPIIHIYIYYYHCFECINWRNWQITFHWNCILCDFMWQIE